MFPRWLSWMFLAVMLYMIYAASQGHREATAPAKPVTVPAITETNYPALAEATDVEAWKRRLNPDYAAVMDCSGGDAPKDGRLGLKMIADEAGQGTGARCGDPVTLDLTVWNAAGDAQYTGRITFDLGSKQLARGLDHALLGIRPGGVRTVVLPPAALVRNKESTLPAPLLKLLPNGKGSHAVIVTAKRVE